MSRIVKVEQCDLDSPALMEAADIMRAGGLVVFPTETVYGLGTIASSEQAVMSVFKAKRRNDSVPLPVQIADANMLTQVSTGVNRIAAVLADHFWPGPLTIVLPKNSDIPDCVTSGQSTVGIRIPDHPVAVSLLEKIGCPIVATSANISGCPPPVTAQEAAEQIGNDVDMIIDSGPCVIGTSSTVVSILDNNVEILRLGTISLADIQEAIRQLPS